MIVQNQDNRARWFMVGIILVVIIAITAIFFRSRNSNEAEAQSNIKNVTRETAYMKGNENAMISIVEFSDFECPACANASKTIEEISEKYSENVKIAFRHFPLPMHQLSKTAALAAETAGAQGKFWEMHNMLFEHQKEWSTLSENDFIMKMQEYAENIGVSDIDQFQEDMQQKKYIEIVNTDAKAAEELELRGTPTFFVNGKKLKKASKYDIEQEIENILRKNK